MQLPAEARGGPARGLASPEAPSTSAGRGQLLAVQVVLEILQRQEAHAFVVQGLGANSAEESNPATPKASNLDLQSIQKVTHDVKPGLWLQSPGNSGPQLPVRMHSRRMQRLKDSPMLITVHSSAKA